MTAGRSGWARWAVGALALASAACPANGEGFVRATFTTPECPPGERLDALEGYGWEPERYATDRFFEILLIQVQRYRVGIFETDSVGIRLDLEGLEQAGRVRREGAFFVPTSTPLALEVGDARDEAQVVLSLFRTCERFPGFSAIAGQVVLDELRVRIEGEDTGDDEQVAGRVVTATLSYQRAPAPVAVLEASFDFAPPRRPLREFE